MSCLPHTVDRSSPIYHTLLSTLLTGSGYSVAKLAQVRYSEVWLDFMLTFALAWSSGSMTTDGVTVLAFAYSTAPVDTPSDPNSTFVEHTDCRWNFFPKFR